MKYLDEYRDPVLAKKLLAEIHRITTRPWTLMEVCGGQTHTIVKQGIDEALPEGVRMIRYGSNAVDASRTRIEPPCGSVTLCVSTNSPEGSVWSPRARVPWIGCVAATGVG